MPRIIVPPFQHKSGSTELEHALDARRLDEAFSELAGVLNGGVDESNLSAGVKFSTVTPGGANVGTAIAAKYSLVTLRSTYLAGRYSIGLGSILLGHSYGSVFRLYSASLVGEGPNPMTGPGYFIVAASGVGALNSVVATVTPKGTGYRFTAEMGSLNGDVAAGSLITASGWDSPTWLSVEATFLVGVL